MRSTHRVTQVLEATTTSWQGAKLGKHQLYLKKRLHKIMDSVQTQDIW
jgi:hypothetical protein